MRHIGLFFGSFNPIHIGHLALANYMLAFESLQEVWFVVSPQNPFKQKEDLLDAHLRVEMVRRATQHQKAYKVEDIELQLPTPSYTIDTLRALKKAHKQTEFSIIMGADNIQKFDKWKAADEILANHRLLIYPRPGYSVDTATLPDGCKLTNAPQIELASSDLRQWLKAGTELPFLIPECVMDFIKAKGLYA
ncbi:MULTISPECIES: nicotinate (nicotinamide) nucleotide adenylyltransferase [unclassified Carboxylicivirga]|uniref:nicotinate (nicotinamide) nucleotide adenylyltransferase n=1 Tax=Carboxylicivirga TaxID=1628153 RepID=UPI003D32EAAA